MPSRNSEFAPTQMLQEPQSRAPSTGRKSSKLQKKTVRKSLSLLSLTRRSKSPPPNQPPHPRSSGLSSLTDKHAQTPFINASTPAFHARNTPPTTAFSSTTHVSAPFSDQAYLESRRNPVSFSGDPEAYSLTAPTTHQTVLEEPAYITQPRREGFPETHRQPTLNQHTYHLQTRQEKIDKAPRQHILDEPAYNTYPSRERVAEALYQPIQEEAVYKIHPRREPFAVEPPTEDATPLEDAPLEEIPKSRPGIGCDDNVDQNLTAGLQLFKNAQLANQCLSLPQGYPLHETCSSISLQQSVATERSSTSSPEFAQVDVNRIPRPTHSLGAQSVGIAPPVTAKHLRCMHAHRIMHPSRNTNAPLPCMACGAFPLNAHSCNTSDSTPPRSFNMPILSDGHPNSFVKQRSGRSWEHFSLPFQQTSAEIVRDNSDTAIENGLAPAAVGAWQIVRPSTAPHPYRFPGCGPRFSNFAGARSIYGEPRPFYSRLPWPQQSVLPDIPGGWSWRCHWCCLRICRSCRDLLDEIEGRDVGELLRKLRGSAVSGQDEKLSAGDELGPGEEHVRSEEICHSGENSQSDDVGGEVESWKMEGHKYPSTVGLVHSAQIRDVESPQVAVATS